MTVGTEQSRAAICSWCGSDAEPAGGRLVVCPTCHAATTHPAPDDSELDQVYSGWYRPPGGRFSLGGDYLLRLSRGALARRIDRHAPPGPVLDVGCGDGALLDALHARGREAVGIERDVARSDVRAVEPSEFSERLGGWAAIVFWHSLEHLREPARVLDRASQLLAADGLLIVAVPNLESWQARAFGQRWLALDVPRHLVHLPASALISGLRGRGFRIRRVSHWRGGQVVFGWLHGLVGLLPGDPSLYDAIRQPPARSVAIAPGRRAAVLGAGVALSPVAVLLAAAEVMGRAGGSIYVEATRP